LAGCKEVELIAFDMDGVLTKEISSWNYVHRFLGVDNSVNWDRYEAGEISYTDFLKSDVSLWLNRYGKVSESEIIRILDRIELRDGLVDMMHEIQKLGIKTVIISGGIYWLAEKINSIVPFDDIYANCILVDHDGFLKEDGFVLVDPRKKGEILHDIQYNYGVDRENTMAIGDSDHDLNMFSSAEYSVAFNPLTEKITEKVDYVVFGQNMEVITDILHHIST